MKNSGFFIGILLMAALNWNDSIERVYSHGENKIQVGIAKDGWNMNMSNAACLFGIALAALLLSWIYQRLRQILDQGIVTYPRFRIPASFKLLPHRSTYWLLLAFVWGTSWTSTFPGKDFFGSFIATEKWSFGSQCNGGPFWLAFLCITLWNVLQGMIPPSAPKEVALHLAPREA